MSNKRPRFNLLAQAAALGTAMALSTAVVSAEPLALKTADRVVFGTKEVESGQYEAAVAKLENTLAGAATLAARSAALNNLCVAYVAMGELDTAEAYCEQAVEIGTDLDIAYNNRGVLYFNTGRIEESVRDFDLAVKMRVTFPLAERNLNRVLADSAASS